MNYFNTTHQTGEALRRRERKASTQAERILQLFHIHGTLSPSQAQKIYNKIFWDAPITSIRRAITNLTNSGKLIKTDEKTLGMYGAPETCWAIKKPL